jgi:hypothetical protein
LNDIGQIFAANLANAVPGEVDDLSIRTEVGEEGLCTFFSKTIIREFERFEIIMEFKSFGKNIGILVSNAEMAREVSGKKEENLLKLDAVDVAFIFDEADLRGQ